MLLYLVGGTTWLVWGFFISTTVLWHATFTINSLAHVWGRRRYDTADTSRNNLWLALLTMGEGWHNNHHHYMTSARQGFFWWEIDLSYYVLVALSWCGLVWDLHQPPRKLLDDTDRWRRRRSSRSARPDLGARAARPPAEGAGPRASSGRAARAPSVTTSPRPATPTIRRARTWP